MMDNPYQRPDSDLPAEVVKLPKSGRRHTRQGALAGCLLSVVVNLILASLGVFTSVTIDPPWLGPFALIFNFAGFLSAILAMFLSGYVPWLSDPGLSPIEVFLLVVAFSGSTAFWALIGAFFGRGYDLKSARET